MQTDKISILPGCFSVGLLQNFHLKLEKADVGAQQEIFLKMSDWIGVMILSSNDSYYPKTVSCDRMNKSEDIF